jgi:hypothetical protein
MPPVQTPNEKAARAGLELCQELFSGSKPTNFFKVGKSREAFEFNQAVRENGEKLPRKEVLKANGVELGDYLGQAKFIENNKGYRFGACQERTAVSLLGAKRQIRQNNTGIVKAYILRQADPQHVCAVFGPAGIEWQSLQDVSRNPKGAWITDGLLGFCCDAKDYVRYAEAAYKQRAEKGLYMVRSDYGKREYFDPKNFTDTLKSQVKLYPVPIS